MRTHYQNLKIAEDAPIEVIRAAYRALSQQYHPDRNPDPDAHRIMQIINDSYEVLSDPGKRQKHDQTIRRFREKNAQELIRDKSANIDGAQSTPPSAAGRSTNKTHTTCSQNSTDEALWQVFDQGKVSGPFTIANLAALYLSGTITMQTFVSPVGKAVWKPLYSMLDEPTAPRKRKKSLTSKVATAAAWVIGVILVMIIMNLVDQSSRWPEPTPTHPPQYGSTNAIPKQTLPKFFNEQATASAITPNSAQFLSPKPPISSTPISKLNTESTLTRRPPYRRPYSTPYGLPWPDSSSYLSGAPSNAYGGLSSLTVDNSRGISDVHIKLVLLSDYNAVSTVRECMIKAGSSFEFGRVAKGNYELRYRDLDNGHLAKSEPFLIEEIATSTGTQYSVMTLTLYKVRDGNTRLLHLDEEDF